MSDAPAVLAEFHIGRWQTHLLAYSPGWAGVRHHAEYLDADAVRELSTHLATAVAARPGDALEGLTGLDRSGLRALLEQLVRWSEPDQPLVLVPHDVLHGLPLHAVAAVDGAPLLERNPVTYVPSATVLRYCRARAAPSSGAAVAVVDTRPDRPLPLIRRHAEVVAGADPRTRLLAGAEATSRALQDALLVPGDVMYLGVHGADESSHADRVGLALADGRLDQQQMLGLPLSGRIAVLLACGSGRARLVGGDELLGLTRAGLHAGARTVVAGLWSVEELPATLLADVLLQELADGHAPAEALRRASSAVRAMTVADALVALRRLRGGPPTDPGGTAAVDLALAEVHLAGRDAQGALHCVRSVAGSPSASPALQARARATADRAALLRRADLDPDPGRPLPGRTAAWAAVAAFGAWDR